MAVAREVGGAPPLSSTEGTASLKLHDFDVDYYEQEIKDLCVSLGIDYDKIPPAADADDDDDFDSVLTWLDEMVGTSPSPKSLPAFEGQAESPVSPLALKSYTFQASPTSVAFFEEYAVHPDTSSISSSAFVTSTTSLVSTTLLPAVPSTRSSPVKEFLKFIRPIVIKELPFARFSELDREIRRRWDALPGDDKVA